MRSRILYALLLFALGLILLSAVLSNITLGWQSRIVTDVSLSAVSMAGTVMAVLLGVSSVAREVERRTYYAILAKPVSRNAYVLGKWLGVVATVYLNVALMMVAATAVIAAYTDTGKQGFQYAAVPYLLTLGLTLVRLALVSAIAVAFSTFTSSTVATISSVGLVIAGYFTGELHFFLLRSESDLTRAVGRAIYYAVPDLAALDTLPLLVQGRSFGPADVGASLVYGLCYSAFLLVGSCWIFSRRDLN